MDVDTITWMCDKGALDETVINQMEEACKYAFVESAAVMPDVHLGYSVPIGAVIKTNGYVVPGWVGYDIGCGVAAVKIECDMYDVDEMREDIRELLEEKVPILTKDEESHFSGEAGLSILGKEAYKDRGGSYQMGTLGGGNHFLEIAMSVMDDSIWVVVHTGSRGFGHGLATAYLKENPNPLLTTSVLGAQYMRDYVIANQYASRNRIQLLAKGAEAVEDTLGHVVKIDWNTLVNKSHNSLEYKGINGIVHRKGAARAEFGEDVVIPGDMLNGSYVVEGLGSHLALLSCAHGAGRVLGRKKAKKTLDLEAFREMVEESGICTGPLTKNSLAEHPAAYKRIDNVMKHQVGKMVSIKDKLIPIVNFKG